MPRNQRKSLMKSLSELSSNKFSDRHPGDIVGTNEWTKERNLKAYLAGGALSNTGLTRNKIYSFQNRGASKNLSTSRVCQAKNEQTIDNILDFIFNNDWQQIGGGEHDKKWVNTHHYPEQIFDTGSIMELSTGETHYFPMASTDTDFAGVAMNYHTLGNGTRFDIIPNKWIHFSDTRRGRRNEKYQEYCKNREKNRMEFSEEEKRMFAKKKPLTTHH